MLVLVLAAALMVATFSADALVLLGGLAVAFGFQMWPSLAAVCWFPWMTRQGVTLGLAAGCLGVIFTEKFGGNIAGLFGIELAWGRWPLTMHSRVIRSRSSSVVSFIPAGMRPRTLAIHSRFHIPGAPGICTPGLRGCPPLPKFKSIRVFPPGSQTMVWSDLSDCPPGTFARNSAVLPAKDIPARCGTKRRKFPAFTSAPRSTARRPSMITITPVPSGAGRPLTVTLPWKMWAGGCCP